MIPALLASPNHALYNARDARGETQAELAEALNRLSAAHGWYLVIGENQISRWERGINRPTARCRRLLAEYFGLSLADLGLLRPRGDQEAPSLTAYRPSGPFGTPVLASAR